MWLNPYMQLIQHINLVNICFCLKILVQSEVVSITPLLAYLFKYGMIGYPGEYILVSL